MNGYDAAWAAGFNEGVSQARENISRALIDSAGGAKAQQFAEVAASKPCPSCGEYGPCVDGEACSRMEVSTPQPDGGDSSGADAAMAHAWLAVVELLDELHPGWLAYAGGSTGLDKALNTIRSLASRPSAAAAVPEGFFRVRDSIRGSVVVNRVFPTDEILEDEAVVACGAAALRDYIDADPKRQQYGYSYADAVRAILHSMLAAAPAAPKGGVVVTDDMADRAFACVVGRSWTRSTLRDALTAALASPRAEQGGQEVGNG